MYLLTIEFVYFGRVYIQDSVLIYYDVRGTKSLYVCYFKHIGAELCSFHRAVHFISLSLLMQTHQTACRTADYGADRVQGYMVRVG